MEKSPISARIMAADWIPTPGIEYTELLKKKKEAYPDYRKARDEMQELMKAQKNVEMFFAEEKDTAEKEPTR